MKKDKEFFNLCINGDKKIIDILKDDKEIKNIKDNNGNSIYTYLLSGSNEELLKELIENKLLSYNEYKKEFNKLMINNYKNDKYLNFLRILNSKDQIKFLEKNINIIIEENNSKTILLLNVEELSKKINFISLTKCNEEMLDIIIDKVKSKSFMAEELKEGFNEIKNNKIRTSKLMEIVSWQVTPQLYEDLNQINNYCISYLENKDLYNKLEKSLKERNKNNKRKI